MVAALTHDLRTPLAVIQGHIESLQDGLKNDRGVLDNYLRTIEQNTVRVKNLVDEMNFLTEVDSADFALNPSPVGICDFVEAKVKDLKILAAKKTILIETEITDCRMENRLAACDADRLAQVFDNIVGNSIRFTPQGGLIKITVVLEETAASFKICDNGPGFDEKDLPQIFKKFFKSDRSRSLEKGHSGLGLYIAKLIVEKHGGVIKAANLAGGGAMVEFSIKYQA